MKPKRLADLASQMCNGTAAWSGSLHPDERDEHVQQCDEIKRALRVVILNAPQYLIDLAEKQLENVR